MVPHPGKCLLGRTLMQPRKHDFEELCSLNTKLTESVPKYLVFLDEHYGNGAIILCVFGSFLFVLGFLGCCGALKESNCMVYTLAMLLAAIVLTEVSEGAMRKVMFRDYAM